MAVFEVICTVAATLWIGFVVGALVIGYRITAKLRARRRRFNRLFDAVRAPLGFRSGTTGCRSVPGSTGIGVPSWSWRQNCSGATNIVDPS